MSEHIEFIDVSSVELARWIRLQHVPVPAPLQLATFNRVEIPAQDWEAVVRRPDVTVANMAMERDVEGASPQVAEALLRLAHIFDAPELSVFFHRQDEAHTVQSVGVSRGSQGILVIDLGEVTRLAVVPASNLVAPLVAQQPRLTPAPLRSVELSPRERDEMQRAFDPARPDGQWAVLRRRGLGEDEIEVISQSRPHAVGIVGAFSHRGGHLQPSPVGADWYESASGSYLKCVGRQDTLTFQPADRTALAQVASSALAAAV